MTVDPLNSNRSNRTLNLFDCVCIIVGTIIGAGIFKIPSAVAANVPDLFWLFTVWIVGGFVALAGALCFAELTTTYPDSGGDYGYLKRAYHQKFGFAFSWCSFWVIRPCNIGTMAFICAEFLYGAFPEFWDGSPMATRVGIATAAIGLTTAINLFGLQAGKLTQNILTVGKVAGIFLVILAAFLVSDSAKTDRTDQSIADLVSADSDSDSESDPVDILPEETNALDVSDEAPTEPLGFQWFWFCMVFVMFAFGGWNDIAFVANEVKDSSRNLFGSLVIGTSIVVLIYLTFNVALLYGLGFEKMQQIGQSFGNAPAVLMQQSFGVAGNRIVSLLVCLSCLGAMNGMIFTSPRIYWATGKDYPRLKWLAGDPTGKGFWRAIVLQALVTEIFVLFFGSTEDGFEKLANANAPYFWLFLGFTVIALIVLRIKTDGQFQGYQIPFYPILPILFFSACVFMTYRSADYMIAQGLAFAAVLIGGWVLLGFAVSFVLGDHSSIDDQGSSSRSDQRIT